MAASHAPEHITCSTGPVQIGTQVSETIKTLCADYNSVVKKGEISAELDRLCPTEVDQARATVMQLVLQAQRESGSCANAELRALLDTGPPS